MADFDQTFPAPLADVLATEFDYDDGDGMDFEPYTEFQSARANASWIQAWTGNKTLDGAEYRIFGQDGSGGYAMFWLTRPGAELLAQPIVFFGSEGELSVIARNFGELTWILAAGYGPYEAASYDADLGRSPSEAFTTLAQKYAPAAKGDGKELVAAARAEFPTFEADVRKLCG